MRDGDENLVGEVGGRNLRGDSVDNTRDLAGSRRESVFSNIYRCHIKVSFDVVNEGVEL